MEKNIVTRAKKAKSPKKAKPPKLPKQKKEKRSVKKQRKLYEKALKKASPERTLAKTAILLGIAGVVLQELIDREDEKKARKKETDDREEKADAPEEKTDDREDGTKDGTDSGE